MQDIHAKYKEALQIASRHSEAVEPATLRPAIPYIFGSPEYLQVINMAHVKV